MGKPKWTFWPTQYIVACILKKIIFFFFYCTVQHVGSLCPDQGLNPHLLHLGLWSLNHWTLGKSSSFFVSFNLNVSPSYPLRTGYVLGFQSGEGKDLQKKDISQLYRITGQDKF